MDERTFKIGRSGFRYRANRNEELTIQNELEELEKQSIREITQNREQRKHDVLSDEFRVTRKLAPHFKHKRVTEKRKSEPMFPKDPPLRTLKPDLLRVTSAVPPNSPTAGSKQVNVPQGNKANKTRRYPYCKDDVIRAKDMSKTHKTSIGVLPLNRDSMEISELKVILEGLPVNKQQDLLDNISLANPCESQTLSTVPDINSPFPIQEEIPPLQLTPRETDDTIQSKPAILGKTGTTQPIKFSERQKPPVKPMTKLKSKAYDGRCRSAKSIPSSLMSGEIILPGQPAFSQFDEALDELESGLDNVATAVGSKRPVSGGPSKPSSAQQSRPSSTGSYKSAKALLEEAKRLTSPQTDQKGGNVDTFLAPGKSLKKGSKSEKSIPGKDKGEKSKARSMISSNKDDESGTMSSRPRSERTVDEIITQLRIQSRTGEMSEADMRIQEIMDQVLSRTSAYLSDPSDTVSTPDVQELDQSDTFIESHDLSDSSSIQSDSDKPSSSQPVFDTPKLVLSTTDLEGIEPVTREYNEQTDIEEGESSTAVLRELDLDPAYLPDVPPPVIPSESQLTNLTSQQTLQADEEINIQQAWKDLLASPVARYEDIVSVEGKCVEMEDRRVPHPDTSDRINVQTSSVSFLSTWAPVTEDKPKVEPQERVWAEKTIHHFCTATQGYQLPKELQGIGRKYHTPSQYNKEPQQPYRFIDRPVSTLAGSQQGEITKEESEVDMTDSRRQSWAANRILEEACFITEDGESLEAWEKKAAELFSENDLSIEGTQMELKSDESRLYWTPAPPRLDVPPAKVKEKLFPQYEGRMVADEFEISQILEESSEESDDEEPVSVFYMNPVDRANRDRVLARKYKSNEDLTKYIQVCKKSAVGSKQNDETTDEIKDDTQDLQEPPTSADTIERQISETVDLTTGAHSEQDILPVFPPIRRSQSVSRLLDDDDDTLIIPNDFSEAMDEMSKMKEMIADLKSGKRKPEPPKIHVQVPIHFNDEIEDIFTTEIEEVDPTQTTTDIIRLRKSRRRSIKPTPAEKALAAGRAYVILPKKRKKSRAIDMSRVEAIQRFLAQPSNNLTRSKSNEKLHRVVERELRVPPTIRSQRRGSLPSLLDFNQFASQKATLPEPELREWVRDIWNLWFDQVFPPTPEHSEHDDEEVYQRVDSPQPGQKQTDKNALVAVPLSELDSLDCLGDSEENQEIREILMEEVDRLTQVIKSSDQPAAFNFGRRGAIYRKLGKLNSAMEDINKAIQMEPLLLDAYWHRHLISLVLEKKQAALDDLTYILKHNKGHAGAYRSMAEIFRNQGEITMAIVNYTQAIKLNPEDHDAYSRRAEMYEKRGEMRLALEDYSKATKLQPTKTDALFKHGMYFFQNEGWTSAINDFTELLKVDPTNSQARMYRGRAYANLGQYNAAVADLSGAIHMDPNNWTAFYHRGCLLRRAHPQRALLDFSQSLLIEDSELNLMSYFHRGILYNSLDKPQDAIPDFEAVLKLDNNIAVAHINLGLIYMTQFQDYMRAIKKFTAAMKVDPTCVRAIVCRGQCYHKIHDIPNALRDFTRAIHLAPDVHHYYMYRGQLVLELGNLKLAAFCVQHASELGADASLGEKSSQRAIVQTFLKNYDKAVEVLMAETRVSPTAPVFIQLGKTQIKAKSYKDAIGSFERALALYKPWSSWEVWPIESAEAHFYIGTCHTELRNYTGALESFNSAIKINSHHAESYYQRGLTRIRLKQPKGIQDFNRALALDPTLFQVYLSRACYYGMKGKFAKAILNCNEALKLQPKSVRAYLYRGSLKYHIKAFELAIKDLTIAASINSSCALAYFNRAVCFQHNKQYDKALSDYGIVLLLGEQLSIKVLINRGLLYFERGDYANALYDFKMAAKLHPWDYKIHHSLGLCYHKLNQLQESVVAITKSLVEKPDFLDGLVARGNVYMDYGHTAGQRQARIDYQRALLYDPTFLPARVNLAYSLQVQGLFMQAWKQFTAAINIKPTYSPALEGRAIVNLQMSDRFAAFQDISAAINVSPSAELYTNRGVINQFMKDGVNAMKDYQLALKKDPTYALAYFNAANIHFHTRHFKQALDYYNKAIKYNPKDESAFLNRAITKVLLRDAPGALEDFKVSIKLSPHSAHIYFNRGNLYASMQKLDKAELDYDKALFLKPADPLVLKRRADVRGKLGKRREAIEDYRQAVTIQSQQGK